ncbi:riboflavin kinase, partial [Candidatus Aerophobetes bacterium]|nr:riboflavin kinase [Candidatus Aerophobetes bacterium]
PPTILGKVVRGKGRGRLIGYPTANLKPHPCKLLPCSGVYAGRITLEDGSYDGIINVGSSPTFGESFSRIEAHIINFEGDLYDREVKIELMERIREIRKFSSPTLLTKRLEKDKQIAEKILSGRKNDA